MQLNPKNKFAPLDGEKFQAARIFRGAYEALAMRHCQVPNTEGGSSVPANPEVPRPQRLDGAFVVISNIVDQAVSLSKPCHSVFSPLSSSVSHFFSTVLQSVLAN